MSDTGVTSVDGQPTDTDSQVEPQVQQTDGGEPTTPQEQTPQQLADEATAKATRLEQEMAKYAKVMQGLGIDPDSDFADKFNQGLVTKEELVQKVVPHSPVEPTLPPTHTTPADRLAEIITRVETDGATEDDFKDAVTTFKDYISGQEQQKVMSNQELLAQQCERTVVDRLLGDDYHKAMPNDELKHIEERLFLSSTDSMVGVEARKTAHPERYLNPDVYSFYAEKNAEDLNKLRGYYEKTGFDKGVAAARGQTTNVQPISPSSGGAPIPSPQVRIDASNVKQMAKQYLDNIGRAV